MRRQLQLYLRRLNSGVAPVNRFGDQPNDKHRFRNLPDEKGGSDV